MGCIVCQQPIHQQYKLLLHPEEKGEKCGHIYVIMYIIMAAWFVRICVYFLCAWKPEAQFLLHLSWIQATDKQQTNFYMLIKWQPISSQAFQFSWSLHIQRR